MRYPHICPHCEHRSTRWWNLKVHIKRKHGAFLHGRSSGRFMANNPPLYSKSDQFQHATVADSIGNAFEPKYIPEQPPIGISQYSVNPMYPPRQIMNVRYGTSLSQDTILKIEELKRLVNKYHQYQNIDPDVIVKWAVHGAFNGDTKFLHDKLDLLHTICLTDAEKRAELIYEIST